MRIIIELTMAQLKTLQLTANKEFGYYKQSYSEEARRNANGNQQVISYSKDGMDHWQEIINILNGEEGEV